MSEASPLVTEPSPVAADTKEGLTRKKRKYTQAVMKPKYARNMAVSVPRITPDIVLVSRKMAGKCLTRMRTRPLAIATVCSGTSCLKETRKPAWIAMPPEMVVWLFTVRCVKLGGIIAGIQCSRGSCDQVPKHVEHEAQDVRDHSHEHDEFGELLGAPCTLKIAPAIEDCEARYDEPQKVLLYDCRQCKHPWIYDRPAWHDGEVGDAISDANEGLFDLFHPVRVWSQCKVEQGEDDEAGEQAPSQRRQVYASHGMGWARDAGESEGG